MEDELFTELYEQRLLIFVEEKPQSNKYRQLYLNKEQFKKVSDTIAEVFGAEPFDEEGNQKITTMESEESYELPDLKTINE